MPVYFFNIVVTHYKKFERLSEKKQFLQRIEGRTPEVHFEF